MDKKTGCQGSCPLGKVLGQRECPGKKAKEKVKEWLRGQPEDRSKDRPEGEKEGRE